MEKTRVIWLILFLFSVLTISGVHGFSNDIQNYDITEADGSLSLCFPGGVQSCSIYSYASISQLKIGDTVGDDMDDIIINLEYSPIDYPGGVCFNSYGSSSGAFEQVRIKYPATTGADCNILLTNNNDRQCCISASANLEVTKYFNNNILAGAGTISAFVGGILSESCGIYCTTLSKLYDKSTIVQLTAYSANGYAFQQWEGEVTTGSNPYTISMNNPRSIKAIFTTCNCGQWTSGVCGDYPCGSGYRRYSRNCAPFNGCTASDGYTYYKCVSETSCVNDLLTVTKYNGLVTDPNAGSITINTPDVYCGIGCVSQSINYPAGTLVSMHAYPAPGYVFTKWESTSTTSTQASYFFNMPAQSIDYKAVFTKCVCSDSWTSDVCGTGSNGCNVGQRKYTRTCSPTGCTLADGSGESKCETDTGCNLPEYRVRTSYSGMGRGELTVTPTAKSYGIVGEFIDYYFDAGTQIQITAIGNSGSQFVSWALDSDCTSAGTNYVCSLTMNSDKTAEAIFDEYCTEATNCGPCGMCNLATHKCVMNDSRAIPNSSPAGIKRTNECMLCKQEKPTATPANYAPYQWYYFKRPIGTSCTKYKFDTNPVSTEPGKCRDCVEQSYCFANSLCDGAPATETGNCFDGKDNDCDCKIDCVDSDCYNVEQKCSWNKCWPWGYCARPWSIRAGQCGFVFYPPKIGFGNCANPDDVCCWPAIYRPTCGNFIVEGKEQCDNGPLNGQYVLVGGVMCGKDCKMMNGNGGGMGSAINVTHGNCGDGVIEDTEACDDGENNRNSCPWTIGYGGSCQYCSSTCESVIEIGGVCGDKIVNGPEVCDEGNLNGLAGHCKTDCSGILPGVSSVCGNGNKEASEECDWGFLNGVKCVPEYGKNCTYCKSNCFYEQIRNVTERECVPDCVGKSCGDKDECEGTCTNCQAGYSCEDTGCVYNGTLYNLTEIVIKRVFWSDLVNNPIREALLGEQVGMVVQTNEFIYPNLGLKYEVYNGSGVNDFIGRIATSIAYRNCINSSCFFTTLFNTTYPHWDRRLYVGDKIWFNGSLTENASISNISEELEINSLQCTCSDGTRCGRCSSSKPIYCSNGNLVNDCGFCGCPASMPVCLPNGRCSTSSTITRCEDYTEELSCETDPNMASIISIESREGPGFCTDLQNGCQVNCSCKWETSSCISSYSLLGGIDCSGACLWKNSELEGCNDPRHTGSRLLNISQYWTGDPASVFASQCSGSETMMRKCLNSTLLGFFDEFNLVISIIAIAVIYAFIIRKK